MNKVDLLQVLVSRIHFHAELGLMVADDPDG